MPKLVPTIVVSVIDQLFPPTDFQGDNPTELNYTHMTSVTAVLELVRDIPIDLLTISSERYAAYLATIAALTSRARVWETIGNTLPIRTMPGLVPPRSPIYIVRSTLVDCPDKLPSPKTAELKFIPDKELRNSVRLDISSINSDLSNQEWKSATVLAGATAEALLLWKIQRFNVAARNQAIVRAMNNRNLTRRPDNNVLKWDLHEYLEVALELLAITPETAQQTRLAKDYRNLIHPGKEQRKRMKCDRATALTAVAALEHIVRDLS